MLKALKLLLLLLACYLLSLTAEDTVEVADEYTHCAEGTRILSNIQNLRRDCYAALSLVPYTGLELDPHETAKVHPDSDKNISLRLVGNKRHRLNGDVVRLPASFISGNCQIVVTGKFKDKPENQVLFTHMYYWPEVHKQTISNINRCFGLPVPEENSFWNWVSSAEGFSRFYIGQRNVLSVFTYLLVRPIRKNPVFSKDPKNPNFTEEESYHLRRFNVYTSKGLIHSVRWETRFKRPTAPLIVKVGRPNCKTGDYRLLNIDHIRNECNAALRLIPKSRLKIDPQDIPTNRLETDPEKLWGKENPTSSNNIRLPAVFMSENCAVQVNSFDHLARTSKAPFNDISRWPSVSKLAKSIINKCLVAGIWENRNRYWSPIGSAEIRYYMENHDPHLLTTQVLVRAWKPTNKGNSNNPYFTEDELEEFRAFDIYTPTGQINDIQWETPFQRP